jgi:hypothetical protein
MGICKLTREAKTRDCRVAERKRKIKELKRKIHIVALTRVMEWSNAKRRKV